MDLYAYTQIDDYEEIAKKNNIVVPRLRGYRLMSEEEIVPEEEIKRMIQEDEVRICEYLCCAKPIWSIKTDFFVFSARTKLIRDYYMKSKKNGRFDEYESVRWDRIHGKARKNLKYEIKKSKQKIKKQFETFNKYVGRNDVLYIHARIGGNNWNYYNGDQLTKEPWFLEKVDDAYDSTYCDIYAKIKKD